MAVKLQEVGSLQLLVTSLPILPITVRCVMRSVYVRGVATRETHGVYVIQNLAIELRKRTVRLATHPQTILNMNIHELL